MSMEEANEAVMASDLDRVEGKGSPPRACLDGDLVVCTYFYSHRWLRGAEDPPDPDGDYHTKAQALAEFGATEKRGYEYFYWIDFTCIDQVTASILSSLE
jgi:hypothetical protein